MIHVELVEVKGRKIIKKKQKKKTVISNYLNRIDQ